MNTADAKESMASPSLATPATMEKNPRERQLQGDGENQEMKWNTKGPRKKKPKRKKFTPKVIREGISIRKPKKPPAKMKENSSVKRKYVRTKKTQSPDVKRRLRFGDNQEQTDLNETPCVMSIGIQRSHVERVDLKENSSVRKYAHTKKPRSQTVRRNLRFGDDQQRVSLNENRCVMSRGTKRSLADESWYLPSLLFIRKKKKRKMITKEESTNGWKDIFLLQNVFGAFTLAKRKYSNFVPMSNEVEREKHNKLAQDHSSTSLRPFTDFRKVSTTINDPLTPEKVSRCSINHEDDVYGQQASNCRSMLNEAEKETDSRLVLASTSSSLVVYSRRFSTYIKRNVDCNHLPTLRKVTGYSSAYQENKICQPKDKEGKLGFNQAAREANNKVVQAHSSNSSYIVYRRKASIPINPSYQSNVNCIETPVPESKSKCSNRENEIQPQASECVLVCNEEEKTNNGFVQAHCLASSKFIEDCHKVSISIKPSTLINVNCTEPQMLEKVSGCIDNKENEVHEPLASENMLVLDQAEKTNNRLIQAHCPTSCSSHKLSIPDLVNMDLCSQPSASEKPLGCSYNLGNLSYGPQARIELLIAKQVKSKGTRHGRNPFINFVASSSNKMVDVPIACETSCSKKITDIRVIPVHYSQYNNNNYKGSAKKPVLCSLEYIIQRLRYVNINSAHEGCIAQSENALVPFARGGTIVAVKNLFNLIKKQKPRAKVDLDPESSRMWELLMGNESTDGNAGRTDKDKEKWWEEERRAFYGRVDSFIAKMELILGDRQFSPWKGSVVDSVVGVFLTQNVSDHLSSSAFMSLAARFPLRSKGNKETANVETISRPIIVDESSSASEPVSCSGSCPQVGQNSDEPITLSGLEDCAKRHSCCQTEVCICLHPQDGNTAMFRQREIEVEHQVERTLHAMETQTQQQTCGTQTCLNTEDVNRKTSLNFAELVSNLRSERSTSQKVSAKNLNNTSKDKKANAESEKEACDWDRLRRESFQIGAKKERSNDTIDSLDYEAVRCADNSEVACAIRERGQNNNLAMRIKDFLNRIVKDHGSIDLEWLRDVPPEKAKDFLLSIDGLGIKSVECVRLLRLHHQAFPVDTNVGRICVRLGWVPLQPLPNSLPLHLLEIYPLQETVQKYLWPRLCKLDHETLYKLHYLLIAFGKVFCTKSKPNCNACPMRGGCKHFASAFASTRLALPRPEETSLASATIPNPNPMPLPVLEGSTISQYQHTPRNCKPIIELPASPEPTIPQNCEPIEEFASPELEDREIDIEDFCHDHDYIPPIGLNTEEFTQNLLNYIQETNMELQEGDMSKALVSLTPEVASIPMPKLKNVSRLRTTHQVYELKDSSPLLEGLEKRDPDDHSPYLLAIWTPGETSQSTEPPKACCNSQVGKMCDKNTCFSCNNMREAQAGMVRGTLLIPCRTANRGSFPLNGTYFQVNEVFADHYTSHNPVDVPRDWIWSLRRSTVFFGTSVSAMLKDLTTEDVQRCFWRGYVCVRAFDRETRMPKPLCPRLHFSTSMATKIKGQNQQKGRRSTPVQGKKAKGINMDNKQTN